MARRTISEFTSEEARVRFLRAYAELFARLWPVPSSAVDLTTSFGPTRAYRSGSGGVPLLLLPGSGGNSIGFYQHVARLSRDREVIAVDPIGEPGASVQSRPLDDGPSWARWLDEVLTGLDLPRVHLAGVSYGGWIALQHELHSPGSAVSLSLIDSGGFGRITGRFIAWIMACGLAAISPAPIRHRAATLLRNATLRDDDIVSLIRPSLGFRRRPTRPAGLTDDELGRITVPTLAMFGEHSQLYDARATAAHLVATMPTVQVQVVPGAGHDLLVYDPDLVADRIATFIPAAEALDH